MKQKTTPREVLNPAVRFTTEPDLPFTSTDPEGHAENRRDRSNTLEQPLYYQHPMKSNMPAPTDSGRAHAGMRAVTFRRSAEGHIIFQGTNTQEPGHSNGDNYVSGSPHPLVDLSSFTGANSNLNSDFGVSEPLKYYDAPRHDKGFYSPETQAAALIRNNFYGMSANMSMSYDSHRMMPEYPQSAMMHDPNQEHDDNNIANQRYPSPPPPLSEDPYTSHQIDGSRIDAAAALALEDLNEFQSRTAATKEGSDAPSPGRSKPIPKPDREVTKGDDGRFICTWPGCNEEVRSFNRKCEWSKHMDKHDRPYKCPAEGCEKLPGFTYSGGLLRHQREVHNLHGGPKKQLNCPHLNCKRFSGKGFSRQENLNEHMRRVHTDGNEMPNGEETEEETAERASLKRKRPISQPDDGQADIRSEMTRLRIENEELRRAAEIQSGQLNDMSRQLQELQSLISHQFQQPDQNQGPQAPQASMM